jgi:fermentation-respiration switch protein FrsA (DUF1100 family)
MRRFPFDRRAMQGVPVLLLVTLVSCGGHLATRPGVFEASGQEISVGVRKYHATFVKPANPQAQKPLIAFFTGDAGWMGASGEVFEHLAEQGYYIVGLDSREAVKPVKQSGKRVSVSRMADALAELFSQAKSNLGLPATTPLIVIGFSRGASGVAFTAVHPRLHQGLAGAIAIALTREYDYLKAPDPADRPPQVQVDDKGRIQTYPALDLIRSVPLAVIQSTNDKYVPSKESRRLLGPDTPMRRLYEVEAKNHGFSGGRDALLRDLDDALRWIEKSGQPGGAAPSP